MGQKVVTNMADTTVQQGTNAAKNYAGAKTLTTSNASGKVTYAYIMFAGVPTGADVVIESAVLRLFAIGNASSATISVSRNTTAPQPNSKLTYNNRPSASSAVASFTGAFVKDAAVDIDVTTLVSQLSQGAVPNYGIRLSTTATTNRTFYSANAIGSAAALRPQLIITYSVKPSKPSGFVVTGGLQVSAVRPTLPWQFTDTSGGSMVAYRLQANTTNTWTSPYYDSGEVPSGTPQHTWHADMSNGQTAWYRVQVKNDAGRWSDWSDGQFFGRTSKAALTITAPTSGGTVNDYTPTITWSFAGVQTGFRASIARTGTGEVLASTVSPGATDASWAPSTPLPVSPGDSLTVTVAVDDEVDRVSTPGDPAQVYATPVTFTVGPLGSVDPVTSLVVSRPTSGPAARVTWSRMGTADAFIAERRIDGGSWRPFQIDPADVALGGNNYRWDDVTAPPRHLLEYRVRAVIDGAMSNADTIGSVELDPWFIWLSDPDDPTWILPLAGQDEGEWQLGEDSSIINVLGSDRSVLVHEGIRGYEGSVSGLFVDQLPKIDGLTAQQLRDRAWRLRSEPTRTWRLSVGDMNIPVVVRNVNIEPTPGPEDVFGVSLEFFQQGEVPALGWVA